MCPPCNGVHTHCEWRLSEVKAQFCFVLCVVSLSGASAASKAEQIGKLKLFLSALQDPDRRCVDTPSTQHSDPCVHACICTYTAHTYIRTCIHTYVHTYAICILTCTYMQYAVHTHEQDSTQNIPACVILMPVWLLTPTLPALPRLPMNMLDKWRAALIKAPLPRQPVSTQQTFLSSLFTDSVTHAHLYPGSS